MSKTHHKRKTRRQAKQALKYGPSAKPTHKLLSGRTGDVHQKRVKAGMTRNAKPPPA